MIAVNSEGGTLGGNGHGTFTIPGSIPNGTPSGSFQGTDGGSGDLSSAQTSDTAAKLLSTCDKKGLKSIDIETNTNTGAPAALNLS